MSAIRAARWLEIGLDISALLLIPLLALVSHGVAPLAAFAGLCAAGLVACRGRGFASQQFAGLRKEPARTTRSPPPGVERTTPTLPSPACAGGFSALKRGEGNLCAASCVRSLPGAASILAALLLWGGLSAIWGINPVRSLVLDLQLSGLFLTGCLLLLAAGRITAPQRIALCLCAGAAVGLAMAGCDLATGGALTRLVSVRGFRPARLDQIAMALAILPLPAGAVLAARGRPLAGIAVVLVAGAAVFLLDDVSAKAALLASLPVGALLYWRLRTVARIAAALCALFILTAPLTLPRLEAIPGMFAAADSFKTSAGHRLLIWSFTGDHIAARPLLGWGLDSSRAIPGGNKEARPGQNWLPLHPHDAALQVWLELGVPGAALFAAIVAVFWLRLDRLPGPRLYIAAAGGGLAAALAPLFASYGVWQEWWISTLALALFLVVAMGRAAEAAPTPPRPGWRAGGR